MSNGYPYKSKLRAGLAKQTAGVDYVAWQEDGFKLKESLTALRGELVEVAGPTFDGFYFLDGMVLPRELAISNVADPGFYTPRDTQRAAKRISRVIDAGNLPFVKGSMGLVLCHYLTLVSEVKATSSDEVLIAKVRHAETEMAEIVLGLRHYATAVVALRVQFLRQAYAALEPGGLLITDGTLAELEIMNQIGFTPRMMLVENLEMSEIVLQKPKQKEL